ncbi:MAG TPA: hypothetical protein VHX65_20020 [Pirellulales bacterium]|nr:hypothetical protein [Pirellulales bacterium]
MRLRNWLSIGRAAIAASFAIAMALVSQAAFAWPTQTNVGTGFQNLSNSYFSQTGVNFGFGIPTTMPNGGSAVVGLTQQGNLGQNIMFQQGGQAGIPFGLGQGTSGASFGYSVKTSLGTMFFGLTSSMGSDRGMTGQAASVTVMDGGTGFISDTSQSPFVTGLVPVVGDNGQSVLGERLQRLANGEGTTNQAQLPPAPKPDAGGQADPPPQNRQLAPNASADEKAADAFERRLSAAQDKPVGEPLASLAEIRAQKAAEDQAVNEAYRQKLQMAESSLAAGKPGVARLYYQQVVRHANGALKQQAIEALKSLQPKAPPGGGAPLGVSADGAGAAR